MKITAWSVSKDDKELNPVICFMTPVTFDCIKYGMVIMVNKTS